ncbi:MAG: sodium/proline symporter [Oscillospiraceae bacterium]|nr:sodium/proline symporter [Oscillospiraceae bacterium]
MTSTNVCIMISIVAYLLLVLGIGVWFSKRNKTTDDFYLGGRKLGPFVTAMSAEASDMSSYLLMGLPGVAFLTGVADAAWTAIGLIIGTYVNWLIVAKRIRRYSTHIGATTIPAFFSERFKDKSRILSIIAAIVIIVFFVPYTASGFAACGKLFNSLFGVDYFTAMVVCAAIIILYTMLGGFLAASTSDFIQSIVMTIALIVVLGYGVVHAGGITNVFENAKSLSGYLSMTATHVEGETQGYGFFTICSTLAWGLGYFGMPHILLRFMAIENVKKLTLSRRVASIWVLISLGVAVLIGIIGRGMVLNGIDLPGTFEKGAVLDKERVLISIAMLISRHSAIAAIIAGVILAGILAATMSTADSQLLAASSSVSQNIIKEKLAKNISEKATMIIARVTLVIIAIVGVILAKNPESNVFKIVSFAWAGFGAAFGPVVLAALFWKRTTKWGALAGMVLGGAMVFIWKFGIAKLGGIFEIYELLPAFIVAAIAIVVVSLLTPAPEKDVIAEFEAVKAMKDED